MNAPRPAHKAWLLTSLGLLSFSLIVLGLFLFLSSNDPLAIKQADNTAQANEPNSNTSHPSETVTRAYWSNLSYWGGAYPDATTEVVVPSDTRLVIDVPDAEAKNIIVRGTLEFGPSRSEVGVSTGWILVDGGSFKAGSASSPYNNNVSVTLNNNDTGANISCGSGDDVIDFGNHFIGVYSGFGSASSSDICQADSNPDNEKVGKLEMHGVDSRKEWTVLTAHAEQGDTQITVEDATGWQVGDTIALASTDYDHRQAEERIITAITGNQVSFATPLEFLHFGEVTYDVDQRGEVANLSRNIIIQSDQSLKDTTSSAQTAFDGITRELKTTRGYVRFTEKTRILVDGVEFKDLGQEGQNNRFAVFFDRGDNMDDSYLKNSSIHHTLNRCINLEQTDYLLLENNVAYDAVGNCIALCTQPGQDHRNQYNELIDNLAFYTNTPEEKQRIRDFESKNATFWITHPNNYFEGNVAGGAGYNDGKVIQNHTVGLGGYGYWFELERNTYLPEISLFKDNKAHSNSNSGFFIRMDVEKAYFMNGETVIDNLTVHHNRINNVWVRAFGIEEIGNKFLIKDSQFADSLSGIYVASGGTLPKFSLIELRDTIFVGESENAGTTQSGYDEIAGLDGRTLPINRPGIVNQGTNMVRGVEIYDGLVESNNITFTNFEPNSQRKSAAFSLPYDTSHHMHPQNSASGISYINAQPLDLPDIFNKSGSRAFMLKDIDGSTTGTPNTYIVGNSNTLRTSDCTRQEEWNAYVCPEKEYAILQTIFADLARYELEGMNLKRLSDNAQEAVSRSAAKNFPLVVTNVILNEWYEIEGQYFSSDDGSDLEYEQYYNVNFRVKHATQNGDYIGLKVPGYGEPDVLRIDQRQITEYKQYFSLEALQDSTQTAYYLDSTNDDLYIKVYVTDRERDFNNLWDAHTLIQLRKTPTVHLGETLDFYSSSRDETITNKNLPASETRTKFCSIIEQPSSGTVAIDSSDPHRAVFTPDQEGEFTFEYRPCVEGTGRFLPRETYTVRVLPPQVDPALTPKVLIPPKVRIIWNAPRSEWVRVEDNTDNFNLAQGSTLEITRQPDVGTATLAGRKLTYTPPEGGLQQEARVLLRACNNDAVCGFTNYTFVSGSFQNSINQDVDIVVSNDDVSLIEGQWYTFGVKLSEKPSENVTITIEPSNPEYLSHYRKRMVFTPANWNTLQPLTIKLKDGQTSGHSINLNTSNDLQDRELAVSIIPKPPGSIPADPTPNPGLPVPEEVFTPEDETTEDVSEILEILETINDDLSLDFPESSEQEIAENIVVAYTPDTDETVELTTRDACLSIDSLDILTKDTVTLATEELELVNHLYDFTLSCEGAGDTATIDFLLEGERAEGEVLVKLNNDNTLTDITSISEITEVDIEGETFTRVIYEVEDGGLLDNDGEENGVIVDPVGFATATQDSTDTSNDNTNTNTDSENNTDTSNDNTDTDTNQDTTEDAENTNTTPGGVLPRTGGRGIAFSILGLVILSTIGYTVFMSKPKNNEDKS